MHDEVKYSINIYGSIQERPDFINVSNLFHPKTLAKSENENIANAPIPGIKDETSKWETKGHPARIIRVNLETLELFAKLYDTKGTVAVEARLPSLHTQNLVNVLDKFALLEYRLGNLSKQYFSLEMWHETNTQKDGTIRRDTQFPNYNQELILSGPHFFVGNPLNKTPRSNCKFNSDYDVLNLNSLPNDYLPRTNYVPDCAPDEYRRRTPRVPWGDQQPVTEFYRVVSREMLSQSGERTFIPMMLSKGVGHVNTCIATIFQKQINAVDFLAMGISILVDFFVKTTGMGHANQNILPLLPLVPENFTLKSQIRLRTLTLNCLTTQWTSTISPEIDFRAGEMAYREWCKI